MASDRSTEHLGPPTFAVAKDFKFVHADMLGVAVTTKKDDTKQFALTVFETILIPESGSDGVIGLKPSRQAASVISLTVDAARGLNESIARALADIDGQAQKTES